MAESPLPSDEVPTIPMSYCLDQLPALLAQGPTLVLCATRRLAQSLQLQYDQGRARAGLCRWDSLDARTVGQWFESLGEELQLRGDEALFQAQPKLKLRLLDGFEERLLWERCINASIDDGQQGLFDTAAMAATAADAHAVATGWEMKIEATFASDETRRFLAWRKDFRAECDKRGLIDETRWHKTLLAALGSTHFTLSLPQRVLFIGFDRYTPIEQTLQALLQQRGIAVGELDNGEDDNELQAVSYPDSGAECLAAALWAKDQLAVRPQARLGIVIPDLAGCRELIHDTLDDILAPWAIRPAAGEGTRPFNISLGKALNRYPLVAVGLELLRLLTTPKPVEQTLFSQLLRSPFWSAAGVGNNSEADARARIEAGLREGVAPKAQLKRYLGFVLYYADKHGLAVPQLLAHLQAMESAAARLQKRKLPSLWAGAFVHALAQVGWLAERNLSSHEYQTRQAFLEETRKLAGLDALLGEVNAATALKHLGQLCGERVFQAKTQGSPAIQVLGLLETTGLTFDALWVMGMTDAAWPPPARPNPLLPAELQRDRRSPNASATVQLEFAATVQRRLRRSAPRVTFSWPRGEGATELRPSPLLTHLFPAEQREAPASPHWAAEQTSNAYAPPVDDHLAPAVAEGETVQGGTWLLRAQAICPAWAYFQYRLGAKKLEQPVEGLDPAQRGSLVHDTLEHFWKKIVSLEQLQALSAEQRRDEVLAAVDTVLAAHDADPRQESLKPRFRALERQRILGLVLGWLAVELQRPLPFTVVACEESVRVEIEGIAANMQIDRIDRLEDGRLLVIDYKTGASIDTKNWATERITEPQLPIYAAIAPKKSLGQTKTGTSAFRRFPLPSEGEGQGEGEHLLAGNHPSPQPSTLKGTRPTRGEGASCQQHDEQPHHHVAAVAFAKVLLDDPAFIGLGEEDGLLPKVTGIDSKAGRKLFADSERFPDWDSVLEHWRERIGAIAREVKAGEAAVVFRDEKDLRFCDVLPLLRLAERKAQMEAARHE